MKNLYLGVKSSTDVVVNNGPKTLEIKTGAKWYKRIAYIITNPFLYIFTGKIRY